MTDDFVTDGILSDDTASSDGDFDPNEFDSDDILDDVDGEVEDLSILGDDDLVGNDNDNDDSDPLEEDE